MTGQKRDRGNVFLERYLLADELQQFAQVCLRELEHRSAFVGVVSAHENDPDGPQVHEDALRAELHGLGIRNPQSHDIALLEPPRHRLPERQRLDVGEVQHERNVLGGQVGAHRSECAA